jgi:putative hydrolase of the HAD superfamily
VPLRAVLFDATGTLIEVAEPVGESYARVAARHGAEISAWRLDDAFRRVLRGAPPLVFPGVPRAQIEAHERAWWRALVRSVFLAADSAVRPRDFEACFEEIFRHFAAASAWRVRPGAPQALAALRRAGLATAVVSNFDRRLHGILAGLALAPLLDVVVLPSDAGAAKPDPAILRHALACLGCAPDSAVVVGDDPARDLEPARHLGLAAIDVRELATLADLPDRLAALSRNARDTQDLPR